MKDLEQIEPGIFKGKSYVDYSTYDNKAILYEKLVSKKWYNRIAWGTSPNDYDAFARFAGLASPGTILDAGCGGLVQTAAIYAGLENQAILVDNSIEMLKIAKERLVQRGKQFPGNVNFLYADVLQLPFGATLDHLFSFGMLHLFEDKEHFIDATLRVLKPNGTFYYTCLTTDRKLSAFYLKLLHRSGEVAKGVSSAHVLGLFKGKVSKLQSYIVGSMVFISGVK